MVSKKKTGQPGPEILDDPRVAKVVGGHAAYRGRERGGAQSPRAQGRKVGAGKMILFESTKKIRTKHY